MIKVIAILAFATVALTSCGDKDKKTEVKETTPAKVQDVKTGKLKIAYYSQDSLKANFKFYREQDEYIQKKQIGFQKELERMSKEYQSYVQTQEKRAQQGLLSQNQIQEITVNAQGKEKRIMEYERSNGQKLEAETVRLLEDIGKKIKAYSEEFCTKNNIDVLLIQADGGQIGYITPSMDVTSEYIEFLNAQEEALQADIEK